MARTVTSIFQFRMNILICRIPAFRHLTICPKYMLPVMSTSHSFSTLMMIRKDHPAAITIYDHLSQCVGLFTGHRLLMHEKSNNEILCNRKQVYGAQMGSLQQRRFSRRSTLLRKGYDETSDDSDYDSDDDDDVFEEEKDGPPGYKQLTLHLKSLRADSVLSSGLNTSRARVDELFYSSKLRLNGKKLLKKSQQLSLGDYVDMVSEVQEDMLKVKRVKVLKVRQDRTQKSDRLTVIVRAWKTNFDIDKPKTMAKANDTDRS